MNSKTLSVYLLYILVTQVITFKAFSLADDSNKELILDHITDLENTIKWKTSVTTLPKWFEYFDNTSHLTGNQSGTCSEIISQNYNRLDNADGIWVACDDPTLPLECEIFASCSPEISFSNGNSNPIRIRSVKIRIALLGFATLRFNLDSSFCIDYSYRKDPMSRCQYVEVLPQLEWVNAEILMDDNRNVYKFSIQPFSRFKGDAVLIDKIEAYEYLPCEDNPFVDCTTPTVSTTTITTTTPSDETFPSILDIESDANLPVDYLWELPTLDSKWMEYYTDYENFLDHRNNTSSCSNLISSQFTNRNLDNVPGIWSTCRKSINCDSSPSSCHPSIYYKSPKEHYVYSIKSKFHLQNTAMLRLHAGGKCWDFKFENDTTSACQLFRIPQLGDRWHDFFWTGHTFLPNQTAMEFRLELISQSSTDVVLLDIIEVQYQKCANFTECSSHQTNPPVVTSTIETITTDEDTTTDCDISTTTEKSELPESTITITSSETSELTDTTESVETTTTTDSGGTICTTSITSTTTRRSGSSAGSVINMLMFIVVPIVALF